MKRTSAAGTEIVMMVMGVLVGAALIVRWLVT